MPQGRGGREKGEDIHHTWHILLEHDYVPVKAHTPAHVDPSSHTPNVPAVGVHIDPFPGQRTSGDASVTHVQHYLGQA